MYNTLVEKHNIPIKQIQIPKTFVPNPEDSDYENGFIERYFCQKANDKNSFVFEIGTTGLNQIQTNPYWKIVTINWRLIGPIQEIKNEKTGMIIDNGVYNDNVNAINKAKKDIPNIKSYIINPLQFYKGSSL